MSSLKLFAWLHELGYDCDNIAHYCSTKLGHTVNGDEIRRWRRGARQMPLRIATGLFTLVKKGHPERSLEEALKHE